MVEVPASTDSTETRSPAQELLSELLEVEDLHVLRELQFLLERHLDEQCVPPYYEPRELSDHERKMIDPSSERQHLNLINSLTDIQIVVALRITPMHPVVRARYRSVLQGRHPEFVLQPPKTVLDADYCI